MKAHVSITHLLCGTSRRVLRGTIFNLILAMALGGTSLPMDAFEADNRSPGQSFFWVKQWSDGAGMLTRFQLTNRGEARVTYSIEAFTSDDQPATILVGASSRPIESVLKGTLEPHSTQVISTSGLGIHRRAARGWLRIDADQPMEVQSDVHLFDGAQGGGDWLHADEADLPHPATTRGPSGLFHVQTADTLKKKEFNIGVSVDNFDRMPGNLDITNYDIMFGAGLFDRLELSLMVEAQKGVKVGEPSLLSTYQPLTQPFFPGTALRRLQRRTPNGLVTCLECLPGFYNEIPLISGRRFQQDVGDIYFGAKVNLFSQKRGSPLGIALSPFLKVPSVTEADRLSRGRGTGTVEGGLDVIFSRVWGDWVGTHLNAGFALLRSPKKDGIELVRLKNKYNFSFGFNLPHRARVQLIGELLSTVYTGTRTPNTTFDSPNPVDAVIGLRFAPTRWLTFSGAYRRNLNQYSTGGLGDGNGYYAQVGFHRLLEKPVPPNHPPTVTCSATPSNVRPGETVRLAATASDPDNDPLTYVWKADQGTITQDNATATLNTTGVAAGTYEISVHVTDGRGGAADCTTSVTVVAPPPVNQPPTCRATADRTTLLTGETTSLYANASDPEGDPLTYQWTATAGRISGSGDTVTYEATGAGPATLRVLVSDGKGGTTSCGVSMTVQAPPPPPQAQHLLDLLFKLNRARVDNVAKAQLDDIALKLQSDSKARLVLVGHADKGELRVYRLSKTRAENAKAYLVNEKKIEASRIEVRSAGSTQPADSGKSAEAHKRNRRVEAVFVPAGATF